MAERTERPAPGRVVTFRRGDLVPVWVERCPPGVTLRWAQRATVWREPSTGDARSLWQPGSIVTVVQASTLARPTFRKIESPRCRRERRVAGRRLVLRGAPTRWLLPRDTPPQAPWNAGVFPRPEAAPDA